MGINYVGYIGFSYESISYAVVSYVGISYIVYSLIRSNSKEISKVVLIFLIIKYIMS